MIVCMNGNMHIQLMIVHMNENMHYTHALKYVHMCMYNENIHTYTSKMKTCVHLVYYNLDLTIVFIFKFFLCFFIVTGNINLALINYNKQCNTTAYNSKLDALKPVLFVKKNIYRDLHFLGQCYTGCTFISWDLIGAI